MTAIKPTESEAPYSDRSPAGPATPLSTVRLPKVGHGLAVIILATVAVIFALDWAQSFIISLLLGVLFAYTLNPLVLWLQRLHIPFECLQRLR